MPKLIDLVTFTDERGNLTVVEKILPFNIKRVFYIYGVDSSVRGGHRHKTTVQAAICIQGSCHIYCSNGKTEQAFVLESPSKCLIIDAEDWHIMEKFTSDAILMVFASTHFIEDDYIYEPYTSTNITANATLDA